MLSEIVASHLEEMLSVYPQRLSSADSDAPFMKIEAQNSDFGDIQLYDEGDEICIEFGRFTNSYVSDYDDLPSGEMEHRIADLTLSLLQDVIDDKIEFFGSQDAHGGFRRIGKKPDKHEQSLMAAVDFGVSNECSVWSGARKNRKG